MTDLRRFGTPEELKDWIEEQEDPDEVTEEIGDQLQSEVFVDKLEQYVFYGALSLLDVFPICGSIQPGTLKKKWDELDEDGEPDYSQAVTAVCEDVKAAFKDLTGAVAGGPDREGDTDLEFDDERRIVGMDDWWINDDREGRWMVVIDEFPYFNFERQF
ncbi:hypothetical protein OAL34_02740 [Synechococcus sp. AH-551-G03]|nr:hypothetical protein [Synechococcus sp. AH-551-G03]